MSKLLLYGKLKEFNKIKKLLSKSHANKFNMYMNKIIEIPNFMEALHKVSRSKLALQLYTIILKENRPISMVEIIDKYDSFGDNTVYRCLEILRECGLVNCVGIAYSKGSKGEKRPLKLWNIV